MDRNRKTAAGALLLTAVLAVGTACTFLFGADPKGVFGVSSLKYHIAAYFGICTLCAGYSVVRLLTGKHRDK